MKHEKEFWEKFLEAEKMELEIKHIYPIFPNGI